MASKAVQLFSDRARLVAPNFAITDANRATVAELCGKLDGLPLAIELAAARMRILSVRQLTERLGDVFDVLTGGARSARPGTRRCAQPSTGPMTCSPRGAHGVPPSLTLSRLDRQNGAAMVSRIAGERALPEALAAEIVERADGVPLFVEELARAVIEAQDSGEGVERALSAATPAAAGVPAALHASLMARLDRLGPTAREIAQIGAVIGRDFSYELLAPVADRTDAELAAALGRLTDAGLVFQRGAPPQAAYLFKHALVRDAAYASLLRRRRQALHGQIADLLETGFPERVAVQPELVAYHYTEAALVARAIAYWQRAGERAIERAANIEAIAHLTRGVDLLNGLPESRQRDEQEVQLQTALLGPYMATRGFATSANIVAAARAVELCERLGGRAVEQVRALRSVSFYMMAHGDARRALEVGESCLRLADQLQDPGLLGPAHFVLGDALLWVGDLPRSRFHLEQGLALCDPERDSGEVSRTGYSEHGVNCHSFLARDLWHLGYPEQAVAHSDRALVLADETGHPMSRAFALSWSAALHQLRGEPGRCQTLADGALALANDNSLRFFAAHGMILGGWSLVKLGRDQEGIGRLREGLAAYRETGVVIELPHWLGLLAETFREVGDAESGLNVIAEMRAYVSKTGIVYYEAEQHRLEGELRLVSDRTASTAAEDCFRRALEVARAQQAKSWELRAATSLARLWRGQGGRAEARDLLAPIYDSFAEGFDTADLKDAKALLGEL